MAMQFDKLALVKAIVDEATISGIQYVILEYLYTCKPSRVWHFRIGGDREIVKGDAHESQRNLARCMPPIPEELKFRVDTKFNSDDWLMERSFDFPEAFAQAQLELIEAIIQQHDYTDLCNLLLGWLVNGNLSITFNVACASNTMEVKEVSRDKLIDRIAVSGKTYFSITSTLPKVEAHKSTGGESSQDITTFMQRVQEHFFQLKSE